MAFITTEDKCRRRSLPTALASCSNSGFLSRSCFHSRVTVILPTLASASLSGDSRRPQDSSQAWQARLPVTQTGLAKKPCLAHNPSRILKGCTMPHSSRDAARSLFSKALEQGGYFTAKQARKAGYDYPHLDY